MNTATFLSSLLLGVTIVSGDAFADDGDPAILRSKPAMLRLTYEVLDIAPNETMGLGGIHYLVNFHPDWYVGASAFGALQGERGGFFTGGLTFGTGKRIDSKWMLDTGFFIGGGGGGAAPQGGGMMLRPHVNISREIGSVMVGGGLSYVKFPNGGIESTQFDLTLGIPFDVYYGRAADAGKRIDSVNLSDLKLQKSEWMATVGKYKPTSSAKTTSGADMTASLERVGFEYRRHLDRHSHLFFETAGATGGQSDGYAEVLAGAGYRIQLFNPRIHLGASLAVGGAGGGGVDTGGGLIGKARLGLDYDISPSFKLGLEAGRIESAGSFSANFYGLSLGYRVGEIGTDRKEQNRQDLGKVRLAKWRFEAMHQTVFDTARKSGEDQSLSTIGIKLDRFLTKSFYMSGQAQGAYAGDAGGYAVGLIGAGWETPLREDGRLSFNAELALGAAGGGGVDVGGGAIIQPKLDMIWRFNNQLAARLGVGKVKSLEGKLDSNLVSLGLLYEFSRPEYTYE